MAAQKGIFCLEGLWTTDLKANPSIEPLLDLLDEMATDRRRHIYRDVGTIEEFDHFAAVWKQSRYRTHPILYLAFHGTPNGLVVGDQRRSQSTVTLEHIEELLAGACRRKVIHFGACNTLDLHGQRINSFLKRTGAAAVCGYQKSIPWSVSASLDLLLFQALQQFALTRPGLEAVKRRIYEQAGRLARELQFLMKVNHWT